MIIEMSWVMCYYDTVPIITTDEICLRIRHQWLWWCDDLQKTSTLSHTLCISIYSLVSLGLPRVGINLHSCPMTLRRARLRVVGYEWSIAACRAIGGVSNTHQQWCLTARFIISRPQLVWYRVVGMDWFITLYTHCHITLWLHFHHISRLYYRRFNPCCLLARPVRDSCVHNPHVDPQQTRGIEPMLF